jgi:hypothetical protein
MGSPDAMGLDEGVRIRLTKPGVAGLPEGALGTIDRSAYAAVPDDHTATFGYWVRFDGRNAVAFVAEDDLEPVA